MYNVIECSNNYAKTSKILSQYHADIPNDNKQDSEPFKFKEKITEQPLFMIIQIMLK